MSTQIEIRQGDAYHTGIADGLVDLIVTSPPYYSFREYTDGGEAFKAVGNEEHPWEYIKGLVDWGAEASRVLKPEGNLFVVLGDKYAGSGGHNNAGFGVDKKRGPKRYTQSSLVNWTIDPIPNKSQLGLPTRFANIMVEEGWVLRQTIIWSKPNGIPTNARDRTELTHEYVFHFALQQKHYASPSLRSMKEISKSSIWEITSSEGLRYPKEIFHTLDTDRHYAAFPVELVRRIVTGWCPPNGLILDPFGGSGTVALVAKILNRRAISIDLSSGYTRLARWRLYQSNHLEKLQEKWGLR